jgi:hypothetical protein
MLLREREAVSQVKVLRPTKCPSLTLFLIDQPQLAVGSRSPVRLFAKAVAATGMEYIGIHEGLGSVVVCGNTRQAAHASPVPALR